MISLNFVKAAIFCAELGSMILYVSIKIHLYVMFLCFSFNQSHFTRVYPDFSRKSWSSYNFDPLIYWFAGCQLVALNFQMPGLSEFRRFDTNFYFVCLQIVQCISMLADLLLMAGTNKSIFLEKQTLTSFYISCGYILMPKYIRSYSRDMPKSDTKAMLLKVRVVAVRHLRTTHAKSISKVQVKATIICKQRATDNQTCSSIFLKIYSLSNIHLNSNNQWSMWYLGFETFIKT
jgi:hypothetical protein